MVIDLGLLGASALCISFIEQFAHLGSLDHLKPMQFMKVNINKYILIDLNSNIPH